MFKNLKNRKGQGFSVKVIVGLILMIALGAILLALFIPTAEGVENAGSCTSPVMQAIASQVNDITGRSVIC